MLNAKSATRNLSQESRRKFNAITRVYELDAQQVDLLIQGLEAWDLSAAAKAQVRKDGLLVGGRRHPLLEVIHKSDSTFRACWKELFRDGAGEAGRPPAAF